LFLLEQNSLGSALTGSLRETGNLPSLQGDLRLNRQDLFVKGCKVRFDLGPAVKHRENLARADGISFFDQERRHPRRPTETTDRGSQTTNLARWPETSESGDRFWLPRWRLLRHPNRLNRLWAPQHHNTTGNHQKGQRASADPDSH
jgi:hypothetical protein